MRPSRIVLLLVAIIAGGLAAYLATRGGDQPVQVVEGPERVIEEQKTQILVATAPIGVGQRLSPATVQWADWPEGAVRPEYVTITALPDALEQLEGAVARFEIFPGDPIIERKLVRASQGYLSAVLDEGMRGVSIAVTAASASGGFIVPNDHVDVILTRRADGQSGQISETIVSDVKVLAINTRLGEIGTTGAPEGEAATADASPTVFSGEAIATLALDPIQSETVVNASRVGTLSLALRSIVDFNAAGAGDGKPRSTQAVRVIRFGNETSIMAGQPAQSTGDPAVVAPAAFAPAPVFTPQDATTPDTGLTPPPALATPPAGAFPAPPLRQ